jgi:hypothetical protein
MIDLLPLFIHIHVWAIELTHYDGVPRRNSRPHQANPSYLAVEVDTKEVDTKLAHERGTREDHGLGCCHYNN